MPKPPPYGVIYNWDGAPHGYSEVPQSVDAFIDKTYAPLIDTQVGSLFWCIGEHAAKWPSDVLEMVGDLHGRRYESVGTYTHTENIRLMFERGEDPYEAMINRGRELGIEVYASVRMNDNHFAGAQPGDLATLHHSELTQMRIEHPQWLLGKSATSDWFASSWNMAVPEVREHRFAHVKEIATRYDWDGVELDWQRHAFHFPTDEGYRLRYLLTDVQRAVRRVTDELARKRGKPFWLAARVAPRLETCLNIGYDIPTWIEEGLVDILIPAANAATDPSVDVAHFIELCRNKPIAVYPGLDGGLPDPFVGPEDLAMKDKMRTRAIVSRYHHARADGIYAFNWHANRDSRRELLSQMGSIETLHCTDKIYAATHRVLHSEGEWRGAFHPDRVYGEVHVPLKRTLTEDGPTITLDIADDLAADVPSQVQLRVRLNEWVKGDQVSVSWDGQELLNTEIRYFLGDDPHRISDVSSAVWVCSEMKPALVTQGVHKVKVVLNKRHPQVSSDLVLTDVEVVIQY